MQTIDRSKKKRTENVDFTVLDKNVSINKNVK